MAGNQLSPLQVCAAMAAAGWPSDLWAEGAATAYAESDDNRKSISPTGDYGLFQINKKAWGQFFTPQYPDAWQDPIINAGMGKKVYDAQGWGGWTAHGNAKFKRGLPAARAAAAQLSQNLLAHGADSQAYLRNLLKPVSPVAAGEQAALLGVAGDLGAVLGEAAAGTGQAVVDSGAAVNAATQSSPLAWLGTIGGFFSTLTQANTWLRIGEFLLGAGLILAGVSRLMAGTSVGRTATRIATKAALL